MASLESEIRALRVQVDSVLVELARYRDWKHEVLAPDLIALQLADAKLEHRCQELQAAFQRVETRIKDLEASGVTGHQQHAARRAAMWGAIGALLGGLLWALNEAREWLAL